VVLTGRVAQLVRAGGLEWDSDSYPSRLEAMGRLPIVRLRAERPVELDARVVTRIDSAAETGGAAAAAHAHVPLTLRPPLQATPQAVP